MNQDIKDALKHLEQTIENSAPHVAPLQASTPTDAASLRTANDLLRTRLEEEIRMTAKERARADGLERQIKHYLAEREISDLMHAAQIQERDEARARSASVARQLDAALANLDLTAARLAAVTAAALPIVEDEEGSPYVIVPRALVDALREAVRG